MSKIEINNVKYKLHPEFNLYGASKNGEIISVIKQKPVDIEPDLIHFKVRKQTGKPKRYKIAIFVYESHYGPRPKGLSVVHVNHDITDNRICNLKTAVVKRTRKLSDEEREENNKQNMKKWQNKRFLCPNCHGDYKNSYKYKHFRTCRNRVSMF